MLTLKPQPIAASAGTAAPTRPNSKGTPRMSVGCPICKNVPLTEKTLDEGLRAANCGICGGWWIDAGKYWQWIESRAGIAAANPAELKVDPATLREVKESGAGKFCPECGRFMARAKAAPGLSFLISRCGGCGGIWLDANEWENLRDAGLHDDIHRIFSDSWQTEITRAERAAHHDQLLTEKLGTEALAEIKRIKAWLDTHPKRAELYAFLVGAKDSGPSKR